ncbi:HAD family hydrolase [Corynebacterium epidermidicanis]|nr:HAD family phosphatase [Corynebacterium epidermidicanis]
MKQKLNLLFDLYGVLLRTQSPQALANLERTIGSGPEMWEPYWRLRPGYDAGTLSDEAYWAAMQKELKLEPFDYEAARRVDFDGWLEPDQEMIDYVLELTRAGHRVGLLSNIPIGLGEAVKAKHTWLSEFDAVAMSGEMGVEKPSVRAYELALELLGTQAAQTHFFDDNPANVAAAERAGLKAHLFKDINDLRKVVDND